jgi:hypothetical protein
VVRAAIDALVGIEAARMRPVGPGGVGIVELDGAAFRLKAFNLRPARPD